MRFLLQVIQDLDGSVELFGKVKKHGKMTYYGGWDNTDIAANAIVSMIEHCNPKLRAKIIKSLSSM
jgi:hypothetical protein